MSRLPHALRAARGAFRATWKAERGRRAFTWTSWLAYLYAAFWALGTVANLVQDIGGADLPITLPVQSFWPHLPAGAKLISEQGQVVGGGFTHADVVVSGLGWQVRAWLIAGHVLLGAANVTIGLSVRFLIRRVRGGAPFGQSLSRMFTVCAATIIGCGLAWQLCLSTAGTIASHLLLGNWGADFPSTTDVEPGDIIGVPGMGTDVHVDFWPIGVGLVLLVLARLVAIGGRMQRDTEGLV